MNMSMKMNADFTQGRKIFRIEWENGIFWEYHGLHGGDLW